MFYFVINPVAGSGKFPLLEAKFREYLDQFGIEGEFVKTISPGDGTHLARVGVKKGYQAMVCVGGDGTVNEVVNGIAGKNVLLGIIPFGNQNTITKSLNIPQNWKDAVKVLLSEERQRYNLPMLNDRLFVAVAGIGSKRMLQAKKKIVPKENLDNEAYQIKLKVDDNFYLNSNVQNISIVNASWRSASSFNPIKINPQDDKLELLIRSLGEGDVYSYTRISELEVISKDVLPVHLDYEGMRMQTPFSIKMSEFKQDFMVI